MTPLCANCGLDPREEDASWCIACLMYVEPPLDNDELVRIRFLLTQPRRTALRMLIFGNRFCGRSLREAEGRHDLWTRLRCAAWHYTHPKTPTAAKEAS